MIVVGSLRRGLLAGVLCVALGVSGVAAQEATLANLWGELSVSDRTVLEVAAARSGNSMTTTTGTPNDKFWSALESRGLLVRVPLSKVYGENAEAAMDKAGFKVFAVTDEGVVKIRDILSEFDKQ
jgi:hypothetical protein